MLSLIETRTINNTAVDCYLDEKTSYFTREQIGLALEYEDPSRQIARIHNRHKERLDQFSDVVKLTTTDGKAYDTFIYSTRGMLEICRWSRQPRADMVMDALYNMAEEVLTKGYFSLMSDEALATLLDEKVKRTVNGKKRIRESRQEQTILLDLDRNKISHEDYVTNLRCIWGEDSYGYHKAFDDYMKWYNSKACRMAGLK